MIARVFRFTVFGIMGTGTALLLLAGFQLFYYQLVPMSWWVDYHTATIVGHGPEAALFINRHVRVDDPLPVYLFAELHGNLRDDNQVDQWCQNSARVTAEPDTGPIVRVAVRDLLSPGCNYYAMPCELMRLQVIIELELPYSVTKRRRFLSAPYYPAGSC